jgi:hypothetical protein
MNDIRQINQSSANSNLENHSDNTSIMHTGVSAVGGHSIQHFQQTGHTFAIEMTTRRVWDYARDAYLHRLILSNDDKPIGSFCDFLQVIGDLGFK